jgi:DMSO reductase anchor subunit
MLFTLLGQLSVGGFWAMLWMLPSVWASVQFDMTLFHLLPSLLIGACLGMGMLASFSHLGTKRNAWRMLLRLKKSWLSREIVFAVLFGLGWLYTTGEMIFLRRISPEAAGITAALGLGFIYSMAQVYRLASMPRWNTWKTNARFLVSAFLLGSSMMMPIVAFLSKSTGIQASESQGLPFNQIISLLFLAQLILIPDRHTRELFPSLRMGLILIGIILTSQSNSQFSNIGWLGSLIFLIVLAEETIGRWLFYKNRT